MRRGKVEIRKTLTGRQWYFRVKSSNGKILCCSEIYNSRQACLKGVYSLESVFEDGAELYDEGKLQGEI